MIAYALRQGESGTPIGDTSRQFHLNDTDLLRLKSKYLHLNGSKLCQLQQAWEENNRLKQLFADISLKKHIL